MTAHASVQSAVLAMRGGCYEYLEKPLDLQQLQRIIARALGERRAGLELAWLRGASAGRQDASAILGESDEMRELRRQIAVLGGAGTQGPPVLITGETGVGKGLVARAIHAARFGEEAPWIDVNCAALPASLAEAELFGYERSAFTDAKHAKPALFEAASGGTIFLDEIGELSPELQAKLLKVVESRTVRRLGAVRERPISAAILAASNVDLPAAVAAGRFRADLYHRLAAFTIDIPPLRQRPKDAVLLARHFLGEISSRYRRPTPSLAPESEERIAEAPWPGNVRELRFALERAVLLLPAGATVLPFEHLSTAAPTSKTPAAQLDAARAEGIAIQLPADGVSFADLERAILSTALEQAGGNVVAAAKLLRMRRDALRYRLRKFGIAQPAAGSGSFHPTRQSARAK
jgi:DNA-binding NtrC family response regulator